MSAFPVSATTIQYQTTHLTDSTIGEDLWRYTYTVSDHSFNTNSGFVIFFDPLLYSSLHNPTATVAINWDILVIDPNPLVPDDGTFDALSLIENPLLNNIFSIDFTWLGTDDPRAQFFEIYSASFDVIALGNTQSMISQVSTPPIVLLLLNGLLFFRPLYKNNICSFNAPLSSTKAGI